MESHPLPSYPITETSPKLIFKSFPLASELPLRRPKIVWATQSNHYSGRFRYREVSYIDGLIPFCKKEENLTSLSRDVGGPIPNISGDGSAWWLRSSTNVSGKQGTMAFRERKLLGGEWGNKVNPPSCSPLRGSIRRKKGYGDSVSRRQQDPISQYSVITILKRWIQYPRKHPKYAQFFSTISVSGHFMSIWLLSWVFSDLRHIRTILLGRNALDTFDPTFFITGLARLLQTLLNGSLTNRRLCEVSFTSLTMFQICLSLLSHSDAEADLNQSIEP